ncbi:MAG: PilZ domain-containing protein [Gammaproteobacteria bacterium]
MNDATDNVLGDGLVFEAALPLRWRAPDSASEEGSVQAIHRRSLEFLHTLLAFGEHLAEPMEEEPGHRGAELVRIDAKLNLLLDLVGRFLVHQQALPAPVPVRLGARGLEWTERNGPSSDTGELLVDLFLDAEIPRPLELLTRVRSRKVGADGLVTVQVHFELLDEALKDALERYIFREHRRSIARQRRAIP